MVECADGEVMVRERSTTRTFTFDKVFGPLSRQTELYLHAVQPVVHEVLQGYNCTVFAYGQTGTGKTYTMAGERSDELAYAWEDDPLAGVIPRAMSQLFDALTARGDAIEFSVRVSYLELYNEELFDLLNPSDDGPKLRIFDDWMRKGSVVVQGAEEIVVHDKSEVFDILERGSAKRRTAATLINASSSRSHSVFCVTVHMRDCTLEDEELVRIGKLNLVDLAGSENVSRSGAVHGRAREAGNINQSLLTLGRVIMTLVKHEGHIPYRDSKLTRILQDALGGRSKTTIIATISPTSINIEETLSTLEYAYRAKSITNRPEVNQRLNKRALIKEYTDEMERLRRDLAAQREKNGIYIDSDNYNKLQLTVQQQRDRIRELDERLQLATSDFHQARELLHLTNKEKEVALNAQQAVEAELVEMMQQSDKLRQRLLRTEELRQQESHLKEVHTEAELKLRQQAVALLSELDQSDRDREELHCKVERLLSLERSNQAVLQRGDQKLVGDVAVLRELLTTEGERAAGFHKGLAVRLSEGSVAARRQVDEQSAVMRQLGEQLSAQLDQLSQQLASVQQRRTAWANQWTDTVQSMDDDTRDRVESFEVKMEEEAVTLCNHFEELRGGLEAIAGLAVRHDEALSVLLEKLATDVTKQLTEERQVAATERARLLDRAHLLVQHSQKQHEAANAALAVERERMCDLVTAMNERLLEAVQQECQKRLLPSLCASYEQVQLTCGTCPKQLTGLLDKNFEEAVVAAEKSDLVARCTDEEVARALHQIHTHSSCHLEQSQGHVGQLNAALNEAVAEQHRSQELVGSFAREDVLEKVKAHYVSFGEALRNEYQESCQEGAAAISKVTQINQEHEAACGSMLELQQQLGGALESRAAEDNAAAMAEVQKVESCLLQATGKLSALETEQRTLVLQEVTRDHSTGRTPARSHLPKPSRLLAVPPFSPDVRLAARFAAQRAQIELERGAALALPPSEVGSVVELSEEQDCPDTVDEDSGAGSMGGCMNIENRCPAPAACVDSKEKRTATLKKTNLPQPLRLKNQ